MKGFLAWGSSSLCAAALLATSLFVAASCGPAGGQAGRAKAEGLTQPPALSSNGNTSGIGNKISSANSGTGKGAVQEGIEVRQAWSTTGNGTVAAYMKIVNHGPRSEAVVGVSAGNLGEASLHRTTLQGDMARMEMVQRLELPPGSTVELAPNGLHVMVKVAPGQKGIGINDEWQLVLRLESGREIPVRVVGRLNTINQILGQEKTEVLNHSIHGGEHK